MCSIHAVPAKKFKKSSLAQSVTPQWMVVKQHHDFVVNKPSIGVLTFSCCCYYIILSDQAVSRKAYGFTKVF